MVQLNTNMLLVGTAVILVNILGLTQSTRRVAPPLFREKEFISETFIKGRADEPNFRLPNNTEPIHYNIDLTTSIHNGELPFFGIVHIELRVLEDTRSIVLHARQLTDIQAVIRRKEGTADISLSSNYEEEREFLTLMPTEEATNFPANSIWVLTISYKGELRKDNKGFYLSTYKDEKGNKHYLATTQFESTDARHAFPCYDEPAKRAIFTITIRHDESYTAISGMPVNENESLPGVTVFQPTLKMPTYLVAFIVSDFRSTEGKLNSMTQRVFSRPGTETDQEWALVSGMLIEQRLADYYGIPFAFPKLDQVAVPDFAAGAMENWGLVTYREEYLLYNKNSTVSTQTNIANIIAHEYAHQWFGNFVAIKWWTYLWLKEGFATLFSYQATDDAYPEWGIFQMFHAGEYQSALTVDAENYSRPMTHYMQKPLEISSLYDTISYGKAGSVLHMWQHALTQKVFKRGLHNYLLKNQFSAATEEDLFDAIQTAAKDENYEIPHTITEMMSTWTRQGGYPLLTVHRNYDTGSITIQQEAMTNDPNHKKDTLFYVPINYAVQSLSDFRDTEATHILSAQNITIDAKVSKNDWLICNKQSTGYYRVNYDESNWQLIIKGLRQKAHKIHPRNRAQLMHDAYRLSASGRLKQNILLDLFTYLSSPEDQYAPWATASSILSTFNRYLSGDKDYRNFRNYVTELVEPAYDKIGVHDVPGEQHLQKFTRSLVVNLACLVGIESCLKETNEKLKLLVTKNQNIEPNMGSVIRCNGLRQSGDDEFNYVFAELMNSDDQAKRRSHILSLGCAQRESHIKKFIESSIDDSNELRTQERTTLLNSAYSRGEVGLLACINFLNAKWEVYAELTPGFGGANPLDSDIRGMSQYVVNKDQEKRLLELVDKVKNSDKVSQSLESIVRRNIQANFDWLSTNREPLMSWINSYMIRNAAPPFTPVMMTLALSALVSVTRLL